MLLNTSVNDTSIKQVQSLCGIPCYNVVVCVSLFFFIPTSPYITLYYPLAEGVGVFRGVASESGGVDVREVGVKGVV